MPKREHKLAADLLLAAAKREKDQRLVDAIQVWRGLPKGVQARLTEELVEARAEEICAAHPDVVAVAHGLRTTTRGDRRVVTREPCVVLMVKSKCSAQEAPPKGVRPAPGHFFTFAPLRGRGEHRLCAIPTDIECATQYRVTPHVSREQVIVSARGFTTQKGVITCGVRLPGLASLYAMSCHHVLAMSNTSGRPGHVASKATVSMDGATFGKLSTRRGRLVPANKGLSLDVAFAQVTSPSVMALVLPRPRIAGLRSDGGVPAQGKIQTPEGAIGVSYVQTWQDFDLIDYAIDPNPKQQRVVEWHVKGGANTEGGQSGSPVLDSRNRIVGMHIAGTDNGRAFMLRIDDLFFGANYDLSGLVTLDTDF